MTRNLRQMIRSILIEELAAQGVNVNDRSAPGIREEVVVIRSNQDLAKFVNRLLDITRDNRTRADIQSGRYLFRLDHSSGTGPRTQSHKDATALLKVTDQTAAFDQGLVTEKHIHSLPGDTALVKIGKSTRLTPLASDAARQAGIKIERVKT